MFVLFNPEVDYVYFTTNSCEFVLIRSPLDYFLKSFQPSTQLLSNGGFASFTEVSIPSLTFRSHSSHLWSSHQGHYTPLLSTIRPDLVVVTGCFYPLQHISTCSLWCASMASCDLSSIHKFAAIPGFLLTSTSTL